MCVGLAPRRSPDPLGGRAGPGNVLVLLGARTGRDGIGGASVLASAELERGRRQAPERADRRPVRGEQLIECCLELVERRACWCHCRTWVPPASRRAPARWRRKGGAGIDLDVAKVPLREPDMEPFEIMISESQERMLCVVEPAQLDAVLAVCERWETHATPIGEVTDNGRLRVFDGERARRRHARRALVDECPLYDLDPQEPADRLASFAAPRPRLARGRRPARRCARCSARRTSRAGGGCSSSTTAGRQPHGAAPAAGDAAVLRLALDDVRTDRALAMSIDGNGRRVAHDPYVGAAEAVAECAANLACVGAEPLGLTNCLNFGNPEKPHVAWQLTRAVEGMAAACRALAVPVVGGNVSLYNEGPRARSTRRRSSAWSASCPTRRAPGAWPSPEARATWSRWSARSHLR